MHISHFALHNLHLLIIYSRTYSDYFNEKQRIHVSCFVCLNISNLVESRVTSKHRALVCFRVNLFYILFILDAIHTILQRSDFISFLFKESLFLNRYIIQIRIRNIQSGKTLFATTHP